MKLVGIKKIIFCILISLTSLSFAQFGKQKFTDVADFFVTFGPGLTTSSETNGLGNITWQLGGGITYQINNSLSVDPRFCVFFNYYKWDPEHCQSVISSVENRTSTVTNLLVDIPLAFNFKIFDHKINLGAGLGILSRIGLISGDVDKNEPGITGTVAEDHKLIVKNFWNKLNFLYPEICASYVYKMMNGMSYGAEFRFYLPLGSLISNKNMNCTMGAISFKVCFL